MMINLRETGTNRPLGQITEEQLQYLIDNLEEEWTEDQDYAISRMLVDMFEQQQADPMLVKTLRDALAEQDEIEITWSK